MNKKERMQYFRESVQELLQREMGVLYAEMPKNWNRLRFAGIYSHLARIHYSKWPDDLKECEADIVNNP